MFPVGRNHCDAAIVTVVGGVLTLLIKTAELIRVVHEGLIAWFFSGLSFPIV